MGKARVFVEGDFFGDPGSNLRPGSDQLELRHAHAQLGNIVAGDGFSAFMDNDAMPDTLDNEGPGAAPSLNTAGVRYTWKLDKYFSLGVGAANPMRKSRSPAVLMRAAPPDLTLTGRHENAAGHPKVSGVLRRLGTDDGYAFDTFESALWKLRNAALDENDDVVIDGEEPVRFSRSPSTKAAYESRIDALFAGEKAGLEGVRVLDRSDVLSLLGMGGQPLLLAEGKVLAGRQNHPRMTAEVWKKVPEWVENPAAVFESETDGGLVLIAPEAIGNAPVSIIVRPDAGKPNTLRAHVLLNAYDRSSTTPFSRWIADGLLKFANTKEFPALLETTSGRRLPGTALKNKPGTSKILTEKNLAG